MEQFHEFEDQENRDSDIERFEEMLKHNDEYFFDVDVFLDIADYYAERGNFNKALRGLNVAISQHPQSSDLYLKKGQIEAMSDRMELAILSLERSVSLDPFNIDVLTAYAGILSQMNDHEGAIRYYTEAIKYSDEDREDILMDLAFEYEHLDRYDDAIGVLLEAARANDQNDAALYELAFCYDMSGKLEESVRFYKSFIDHNPYSFTAWYNLGNTYCKLKMYEEAVEAYDYSIVINEDFSSAHFNKGNALMNIDKYKEALDAYMICLESEDPQAITYNYIGECYEKLENYEDAVHYYMKAIDLEESLSDAWLGMGIVLDLQDKLSEGINYIRKAVELEPTNASHWHVLGEALEKMDMIEEAKLAYQKVIDLDKENIEAWLDYSNILINEGCVEDAVEILEEAMVENDFEESLLYRQIAYMLQTGQQNEALTRLDYALQMNFRAHEEFLKYFPEASSIPAVVNMLERYRES